MTQAERNDRRGLTQRQITYAMFDPQLAPDWGTGFIYREALVKTVVARSRKRAESDNPGLKAIPIGSLTAKQKRWVQQID